MRRVAEDRLHEMFVASGGRPERRTPHYFVLGESPWFRGLASDMAELRLPIDLLPEDQTTVTWGDSFGAMLVSRDFGLDYQPRPYHGQLFRLADIPTLIDEFGFHVAEADGYEGLPEGRPTTDAVEPFIEVQLWSDEPVQEHFTT